jgi:branched-chain amino acid transport system permease protein
VTARARHVAWAAYALLLIVAPLVFRSSLAHTMLSQMGIAIIACLSYNLLFGQGGMLSFGHAVFTGLGAYATIHTLNAVLPIPVSLLPLVGGIAGLLAAALFGWLPTKTAGTTFAMITLGLGELVWAASLMFPGVFGGEAGIPGNRVTGARPFGISFGPQIQLYYLIAAYALVCTALLYLFTRTPLGRMLNAVRDNPERAAFVGYNPQVVRYIAFVVAGFFAGIAGGLAALNFEIVTSEVLSMERSGGYLLFVFLGGSAVFFGPVLGGVLMVLAFVWLSAASQAWLLYLGLLFIWMVMAAPGGLAGLLVQNIRAWRQGQWRRLKWPYLWLSLAAPLALTGVAALIEMLYHLQLNAEFDPVLVFARVPLDTGNFAVWLAVTAGAAAALGLLLWAWKQFASAWQLAQADMRLRAGDVHG